MAEAEKRLYWLEELDREADQLVGKKCANLGEMTRLGLPVPPGFALCVDLYNEFMTQTQASQEIAAYLGNEFRGGLSDIEDFGNASKKLRQIVEGKAMPDHFIEQIKSYYNELCERCGTDNVAVSVRSAGPKSHPGQYETYLNVRGISDVLEKIVKVWSSSFNPGSLAARKEKNLPLRNDPIGVAVLKMVGARSSGVIFTADPDTGDTSKMILEANWGLGQSIVSGEVMPDKWVVDHESLEITERELGTKEKYTTLNDAGVEVETLPGKRSMFCLSDEEIREICRLAKTVEQHFGVPQDIEYAVDNDLPFPGNILLLQARAEVLGEKVNPADQVLDLMMKRLF
jgi:pyruvate,water dikinase